MSQNRDKPLRAFKTNYFVCVVFTFPWRTAWRRHNLSAKLQFTSFTKGWKGCSLLNFTAVSSQTGPYLSDDGEKMVAFLRADKSRQLIRSWGEGTFSEIKTEDVKNGDANTLNKSWFGPDKLSELPVRSWQSAAELMRLVVQGPNRYI